MCLHLWLVRCEGNFIKEIWIWRKPCYSMFFKTITCSNIFHVSYSYIKNSFMCMVKWQLNEECTWWYLSYINDLISLSLDCDGFRPVPLAAEPFDDALFPGALLFLKKTLTAPRSISRNQYSWGRNSAKILILQPRGRRQNASKNGRFTTWL